MCSCRYIPYLVSWVTHTVTHFSFFTISRMHDIWYGFHKPPQARWTYFDPVASPRSGWFTTGIAHTLWKSLSPCCGFTDRPVPGCWNQSRLFESNMLGSSGPWLSELCAQLSWKSKCLVHLTGVLQFTEYARCKLPTFYQILFHGLGGWMVLRSSLCPLPLLRIIDNRRLKRCVVEMMGNRIDRSYVVTGYATVSCFPPRELSVLAREFKHYVRDDERPNQLDHYCCKILKVISGW